MQKNIKNIAATVFWLLVWQVAAFIVHNKILLAGPVETVSALLRMAKEADFWQSLMNSYLHIILGILIGCTLGLVMSCLSYKYKILETFLYPLVLTIKAVPVASFIILILIWIGSENVSTVIVSLVAFPIVYIGVANGLKSTDEKLLEMAYVYRMPTFNKFRYIYVPALFPSIISAISLAIPMGFKSGVAAEVIGQPLQSMGNGLYRAKIYLDTGDLFAWTAVIVFVSFVTEKVILMVLSLIGKGGMRDDNRS